MCAGRTGLLTHVLVIIGLLAGSAEAQSVAPQVRITARVENSQRVMLKGTTTPLVSQSVEMGRMEPSRNLGRMILLLEPTAEQKQAADTLVKALHDRSSAQFHKWLTPAEFGKRFGVADSDALQVQQWMQSQGLTVHEVSQSRRFITFSGTVSQVEQAFSTEMHNYAYKGQTFIANSKDVQVPAALNAVVKGPVRLYSTPKTPNARVVRKLPFDKTKLATMTDGSHYLAPGDFATIYNLKPLYTQGINGAGQNIAIVGRSNISVDDVSLFRAAFGLPENNPNVIVNGDDPGMNDDAIEATLDATWAGAVAPNATVSLVVTQSDFGDGVDSSAAYIVDHNLAPVMSTSYGSCETAMGASGRLFTYLLWQQAAAQGITSVVSSGDSGGASCDLPGSGQFAVGGLEVNGLASTPYNVAVGGTEFDDASDASQYWNSATATDGSSALNYIPEKVWNESSNDPNNVNLWATGGGRSHIWQKPDWQSTGNATFDGDAVRDVPDVSLSAAGHDGYLIVFGGDLYSIAGTSASAPSFAGIMSLVNQKTGQSQGQANYVLYRLAATPGVFHDVTSGNNMVPDKNGAYTVGYPAGTGYDLATGLGSVDANVLVNAWNTVTFGGTTTMLALNSGASSFVHGSTVDFIANVTTSDGAIPTGSVALIAASGGNLTGVSTAGSGVLDGSGAADIHTGALQGGTLTVTARYAGDSNYSASTSDPVTVTITPEPSTTTVYGVAGGYAVNSALDLQYGESMPLAVTVAGHSTWGYPSGTVNLFVNGSPVGARSLQYGESSMSSTSTTWANQSSTLFSLSGFNAGNYSVTASYPGDNSFSASTASPYAINVSKADTYISSLSASGVVVPNTSTLIAGVVKLANGGSGPLSGTVTLQDLTHGQLLGIASANADGTFSRAVQFTASGTTLIQATYSGDSNANSSMLQKAVAVTSKANTTTSVTSNSVLVSAGTSVELTATVSSQVTSRIPSGAVIFYDGSAVLGTVSLNSSGTASFSTSGLSGGSHSITASYSGDVWFNSSISSAITETLIDYNLQSSSRTMTVVSGASGSAVLSVVPLGGFHQAVSFSCSNLPSYASCNFSPAIVTLDGTNSGTTTVTVRTSSTTMAGLSPTRNRWIATSAIALGGVFLVVPMGSCRRRRAAQALMLGLFVSFAFSIGCGGGSSSSGTSSHNQYVTAPGTYNISVVSSVGGRTGKTTTLTLTVTQ